MRERETETERKRDREGAGGRWEQAGRGQGKGRWMGELVRCSQSECKRVNVHGDDFPSL